VRVVAESLFFVPGPADDALARRQQALAELGADEGAVHAAPGNRAGLARAMLTFCDASADAQRVGFTPARVDYLLGESLDLSFPVLVCLAATTVIALLTCVALLAGRVATGSATLAPPFLSAQPCVVALAAMAAGLVLVAAFCARWMRGAAGR